jgi:hypothetical protein
MAYKYYESIKWEDSCVAAPVSKEDLTIDMKIITKFFLRKA